MTRLPFDLRFDEGIGPIVSGARRRPDPAATQAPVRFRYPELEDLFEPDRPALPASPPEPAPAPEPTFSTGELAGAVEAARAQAAALTEARVRAELLAGIEHREAEALAALAAGLAASREALERALAARAGA